MDTADVLRRALDATVSDVEPDGYLVLRRRISCIHDAQVELAGLLAGEVGEAEAAASLRRAAGRSNTALIADYLNGAADLIPETQKPPASTEGSHPNERPSQ
jgi:hypothetical protein